MATNREDRFLMRQRGAGTRQIKDVEFEIVLPGVNAPLKPKRSGRSRKTPQPELLPQRSSRRTPKSDQLLPQRSSKRTPTTTAPNKHGRHSRNAALEGEDPNVATTSSKKRGRPSKHAPVEEEDPNLVPTSYPTDNDDEGIATKRRKLNGVPVGKPEDAPGPTKLLRGRPKAVAKQQKFLPQAEGDVVQEAVAEVPAKRRKKRKSIGQNSKPRAKPASALRRQKESIEVQATTASAEGADYSTLQMQKEPNASLIGDQELGISVVPNAQKSVADELHNVDEAQIEVPGTVEERSQAVDDPLNSTAEEDSRIVLSPKQQAQLKPKWKKRKSIGQQKPRRKPTHLALAPQITGDEQLTSVLGTAGGKNRKANVTSMPSQRSGRPKKISSTVKEADQDKNIEIANSDPVEPTDSSSRKRGRPRKYLPTLNEEDQDGVLENADTAPEGIAPHVHGRKPGRPRKDLISQPRRVTTAKNPSQAPKRKTQPSSRSPPTRPPPRNSIPIRVYRLSNPARSNSSLPPPPPHPHPKTPNAIDVLSQITRELIQKSTDSLELSSDNAPNTAQKQELQRKKQTIEIYGEELESRLFELTEVLDMNISLSTRVKRVEKEEKSLRKAVGALKREREAIAVRHAELTDARKKAIETAELEDLLQDIGTAVRRGRDRDNSHDEEGGGEKGMGDFEIRLREVARDVSRAGGEGGLLERVREMNGYLERAVNVL